eukprot:5945798-Prorocentrum_lima.AAC.1
MAATACIASACCICSNVCVLFFASCWNGVLHVCNAYTCIVGMRIANRYNLKPHIMGCKAVQSDARKNRHG